MSEFDDIGHLKTLWQSQQTGQNDVETLQRKVQRSRQRLVALRLVEAALTVFAVLVFVPPLIAGSATPAHWLLLPYFAAFLPWVWWRTLRDVDERVIICGESSDDYPRLRLRQIDVTLTRQGLYRRVALVLLAYACVAAATALVFLDAEWRRASLALILWAAVWWLGTRMLTGSRRRQLQAERDGLMRDATID